MTGFFLDDFLSYNKKRICIENNVKIVRQLHSDEIQNLMNYRRLSVIQNLKN